VSGKRSGIYHIIAPVLEIKWLIEAETDFPRVEIQKTGFTQVTGCRKGSKFQKSGTQSGTQQPKTKKSTYRKNP